MMGVKRSRRARMDAPRNLMQSRTTKSVTAAEPAVPAAKAVSATGRMASTVLRRKRRTYKQEHERRNE